jgi:hypothetical protein
MLLAGRAYQVVEAITGNIRRTRVIDDSGTVRRTITINSSHLWAWFILEAWINFPTSPLEEKLHQFFLEEFNSLVPKEAVQQCSNIELKGSERS